MVLVACDEEPNILTVSEAPHRRSKKHILNAATDQCLLSIFKHPALDMWDLLSVSNVCTRFNPVAKQAVTIKLEGHEESFGKLSVWQVEKLFRTFGHLFNSLDVNQFASADPDVVYVLALKHCPNIVRLLFKIPDNHAYVDHSKTMDDDDVIAALRTLLPKLHQLTIQKENRYLTTSCFAPDADYMCHSLTFYCQSGTDLPAIRATKLVDFTMSGTYTKEIHRTEVDTNTFFELNTQLQRLELVKCVFKQNIYTILQPLADLRELILDNVRFQSRNVSDLDCFTHLKQLNKLTLSLRSEDLPVATILEKFPIDQLTELELYGLHDLNAMVAGICRMRNIVHLTARTFDGISAESVKRLQNELTNLKSIDLGYGGPLSFIEDVLKGFEQLTRATFSVEWNIRHTLMLEVLDRIDILANTRNIELSVYVDMSYCSYRGEDQIKKCSVSECARFNVVHINIS